MKDFILQGFTLQWKDDLSINNLQQYFKIIKFRGTEEEAREYKIMQEEELKENIVISIGKMQIKWYNPTFMIKKANGKCKKDTGCENAEQTDSRLPLQDARLEQGETNNQTWRLGHFTGPLLRISPPNNSYGIRTIPSIRIPEQLLHIQGKAVWNQTLTIVLYNSKGTNNATNMNENRDQNNQLRRQHPSPSLEQRISRENDLIGNRYTEIHRIRNEHGKERDRTESNCNISRMGMESSKRNSENETEEAFTSPTRFIQYQKMDKDENRDNSKTNSEVNRKTKLSKSVTLRSITLPEHNGPSESISCKTERMEYNYDNEQNGNLRYKLMESETQANIPAQLIYIPPQMTMTTDAASSG
ncbi:MAG: hypothetical protein EZS28_019630 [Streblomastix strix]|uniref:Uncharacterized protein n=1 Tax=Streblomastix strix TaxID=222440 RepID=A0A5J4VQR5_9EUKA|nr:MAG: hypothetical protein EZS28_019630 [Streblomastix strix]